MKWTPYRLHKPQGWSQPMGKFVLEVAAFPFDYLESSWQDRTQQALGKRRQERRFLVRLIADKRQKAFFVCAVYAHSQWETALQCNAISHSLGAFVEWSSTDGSEDVLFAGCLICFQDGILISGPFEYKNAVSPLYKFIYKDMTFVRSSYL